MRTIRRSAYSVMVFVGFSTMAFAGDPILIDIAFPEEGMVVRKSEIAVRGRVVAEAPLRKIEVNGRLVTIPTLDDSGDSRSVKFERRTPLEPEANAITITATDVKGAEASHTVTALAELSLCDDPNAKLALAIGPFEGSAPEALRTELRSNLEARLIDSGRFRIVDQGGLEATLAEQRLAGALDNGKNVLRMGKVTPCDLMVMADVIQRGEGLEIAARVISTDAGLEIAKSEVHIENPENGFHRRIGFASLAKQIEGAFPRVIGVIEQVQGNRVVTNLNASDGVRAGTYLAVYTVGEPLMDKSTGAILADGECSVLARLSVRNVNEKISLAQIIRSEEETAEAPQLEAGMFVVML